jgi:hypothetical protein
VGDWIVRLIEVTPADARGVSDVFGVSELNNCQGLVERPITNQLRNLGRLPFLESNV